MDEDGRTDDGELPPDENAITVVPNGPLRVRGDVEVVDSGGATLLRDDRVEFCRCGASASKPLCDGSHDEVDFDADGTVPAPEKEKDPDDLPPEGVLRVKTVPNGPLALAGEFVLRGPDDGSTYESDETALCRCGGSGAKPFCDGAHGSIGFETE